MYVNPTAINKMKKEKFIINQIYFTTYYRAKQFKCSARGKKRIAEATPNDQAGWVVGLWPIGQWPPVVGLLANLSAFRNSTSSIYWFHQNKVTWHALVLNPLRWFFATEIQRTNLVTGSRFERAGDINVDFGAMLGSRVGRVALRRWRGRLSRDPGEWVAEGSVAVVMASVVQTQVLIYVKLLRATTASLLRASAKTLWHKNTVNAIDQGYNLTKYLGIVAIGWCTQMPGFV